MAFSVWIAVALFITAYVGKKTLSLYMLTDTNKLIYNNDPGKCHLVAGIEHGSEDIETLSSGIALITSGLRIDHQTKSENVLRRKGFIYKFDFKNPSGGATKVSILGDFDLERFNPHGLSIWEDISGEITVFVVNHVWKRNKDRIEKFTWNNEGQTLTYISSLEDDKITLSNDIKATGPNSFYLTNFLYFRGALMLFEMLGVITWGEVLHYNGRHFDVVADGLNMPNGINMSPDMKTLYVAEIMKENLAVFYVNKDNTLLHRKDVWMGFKMDNINVDRESGDVWVAGHPQLYRMPLEDSDQISPSKVVRLRFPEGDVMEMEDVFSEPGTRISGSSVASYHDNQLLIGTIFHKMLHCEVKYLRP